MLNEKSKVQNTACYLSHKNGEKLECMLMFAYISIKALQKDTQKSDKSGWFVPMVGTWGSQNMGRLGRG